MALCASARVHSVTLEGDTSSSPSTNHQRHHDGAVAGVVAALGGGGSRARDWHTLLGGRRLAHCEGAVDGGVDGERGRGAGASAKDDAGAGAGAIASAEAGAEGHAGADIGGKGGRGSAEGHSGGRGGGGLDGRGRRVGGAADSCRGRGAVSGAATASSDTINCASGGSSYGVRAGISGDSDSDGHGARSGTRRVGSAGRELLGLFLDKK